MPKITIPQKNKVLQASAGMNLMQALRKENIPVASSCLGDGICGKCRMIVEGPVADPKSLELTTLHRNEIPEPERLSCQIQIEGDLILTTTYW